MPGAAPGEASPGTARLPAWREDLSLQSAPRGLDGAPHWNLYDPVRNRFFRIGWLEFLLLSHWQNGISIDELCARVRAASPIQAGVDDVLALIQFLQQHELLRPGAREHRHFLQSLAKGRELSIWQWLLHHYLFVRIPLLKPEKFLRATQHLFERILRPGFFLVVGLLSLWGVARVIDQWSEFSQTFLYFFSWQGVLCYGLALGLSKLLHEFGHAYMARHYGLRVPTMGVAIMMLWPLLYTDTSEGWKLDSRRARLSIGGAGIIAELMLAGLAALAWSLLPEGALKSAAYVLAAVTWIGTVAINLNPFMRFDGYYLLMDAVDMPNLHERSFAFGRWFLRRTLLGWHSPLPEPEYERQKGWLISYAFAIWLYRLVLFTGIAATVYYFFFKLAGVILFAVEIGWFVVRPMVQELRIWFKNREQWQGQRRASAVMLALLALIIGLAIPWHSRIEGHGYWQAGQHSLLFPVAAARVEQVWVKEGQSVASGDKLLQLQSPELDAQLRASESRIAGLQAQLTGSVGQISLLDQARVWQQSLEEAQAGRNALIEQQARLTLRAPHAGVVRDLDSGLYPGRWLRAAQGLGRVVQPTPAMAHIFVSESDVTRIRHGAPARLLLQRADTHAFEARVVNIDRTASHVLPQALLASTLGGPIAVRNGPNGELLTTEAWYRVTLQLPDDIVNQQLGPIHAYIDGERQSLLWHWLLQATGVLIRESGF
jgi:putative peptide zinc metalloprotease protein